MKVKKTERQLKKVESGSHAEAKADGRSQGPGQGRIRGDRVGPYLTSFLADFVFDELSPEFLKKIGVAELMAGVPVPIRRGELVQIQQGQQLTANQLAENMIWLLGVDPQFKYGEHYLAFLLKLFRQQILDSTLREAQDAAEQGQLKKACIYFRACLRLQPDSLEGLYGYIRVCRDMYLEGGDEDYVGNLKAETMEYLEVLTLEHPDFGPGYYYLGYAYANLGLYAKAAITWQQYLDRSEDQEERQEIQERLTQLEGPVKIEDGCNDVLAGRYEEGIFKLEPYEKSSFSSWWPLYYYLGMAHAGLGEHQEAKKSFKHLLTLQPSHVEAMLELAAIYRAEGDLENQKKYTDKVELILSQQEADRTGE
ncbi:tetratricopeptide repeat protein [Aminipila butyrica]|uniref:Tetratricopeptide repeat protein n=1 Tax=Aminipila butyrica TaxID=433296 RepID=A0A858BY92_9FIRM|nr:tetratricopeptide repeat protein [Aminipila butyrica]QIB70078.1 tetratricopeptide repeat protein [Aminipila butyrica]